MTTFNLPLAVEMLASIEEARSVDAHDQSNWGRATRDVIQTHMEQLHDRHGTFIGYGTCGSAMCAAGWTVTLAGYKMLWRRHWGTSEIYLAQEVELLPGTAPASIPAVAASLLGLPPFQRCDACVEALDKCLDHWDCVCDQLNPHYDVVESYHKLFGVNNTIDDLYAEVAALAETDVEEIRTLVQAQIEEYRITAFPEAVQRVCSVETTEVEETVPEEVIS